MAAAAAGRDHARVERGTVSLPPRSSVRSLVVEVKRPKGVPLSRSAVGRQALRLQSRPSFARPRPRLLGSVMDPGECSRSRRKRAGRAASGWPAPLKACPARSTDHEARRVHSWVHWRAGVSDARSSGVVLPRQSACACRTSHSRADLTPRAGDHSSPIERDHFFAPPPSPPLVMQSGRCDSWSGTTRRTSAAAAWRATREESGLLRLSCTRRLSTAGRRRAGLHTEEIDEHRVCGQSSCFAGLPTRKLADRSELGADISCWRLVLTPTLQLQAGPPR